MANAPAAPVRDQDRLKLSGGPLIEADVAVRLKGHAVATANGQISVDHRLVDRYASRLFDGSRDFKDTHLVFKDGRYVATGTLVWHGIPLPYRVPTELVAEGGRVGVRFDAMKVRLAGMNLPVPDWLARKLMDPIAQGFRSAGIGAVPDPAGNRVMVDPTSLMRELGMLPAEVALDSKATQIAVETSAQGDLKIKLKSPDPVTPARATPVSDIAVEADHDAMAEVLTKALGEDYQLASLEPTPGGFKMKGTVEYQPVSDSINAFTGLMAVVAVASGGGAGVGEIRMVRSQGPLDLDVRVKGTRLSIKPHTHMAFEPLAEALTKAGFTVGRAGDRLEVDLRDLLAGKAADIEQFKLAGTGVKARVHLDLDSLLPPEKLEGR